MLEEIEIQANLRVDFGFETTLSGKGHLQVVRGLKRRGYEVHIFYLWVPSPELTLARIKERVLRGGHDVPEAIVRRRFGRSLRNFWEQYRLLADEWILFDSSASAVSTIAKEMEGRLHIIESKSYNEIVRSFGKP